MVALTALTTYIMLSAVRFERPYVAGYAQVASAIRNLADSAVILVDAGIPANLMFFLHKEDSARRFVVVRKSLYEIPITPVRPGVELIHNRQGLDELLSDDGIRFIVVSSRPPAEFPIENILREMLETPRFRLIGRYSVEGNSPEWKDYYLSLYEDAQAGPPTVRSLRIPMLNIDHDIEVPFQDLGITSKLLPFSR